MSEKFLQYKIDRWDKMSSRDKQMNFMAALKAASVVMEGSKISVSALIAYTQDILEHYYEFEWNQKATFPAAEANLIDKANEESQLASGKKQSKNIPF